MAVITSCIIVDTISTISIHTIINIFIKKLLNLIKLLNGFSVSQICALMLTWTWNELFDN